MFGFDVSIKMEFLVEGESTALTIKLFDFPDVLPYVNFNMQLHVVFEERSVRADVAIKVLDVHVDFHHVPTPVSNHCSTVITLSLKFLNIVFWINWLLVDRFHVHHDASIARRFIVALVTLEIFLLEVNHVDVLFDRSPVEKFKAAGALDTKMN
jgi:hypothetical protein